MAQHIITGSGAPAVRPKHPGQHYVDEAAAPRVTYIGLSTDAATPVADCWQEVGSGGGGEMIEESFDLATSTTVAVLTTHDLVRVYTTGTTPVNYTLDLSAFFPSAGSTKTLVIVDLTDLTGTCTFTVDSGIPLRVSGSVTRPDGRSIAGSASSSLLMVEIEDVAGTIYVHAADCADTLEATGSLL